MDSTLFDHKNSFNDGSRGGAKPSFKITRPTSAQAPKPKGNNPFPNYQDSGSMPPPMGGVNRFRPTTAGYQQHGMNISEDANRRISNGIIEELEPEEEARIAEKLAYEEPLQIQDFQKIMPRHIKLEKEKLYEDTLHLKQSINALKEENMKIKTKNLNLERENVKLVKSLEKLGSTSAHYGKPAESALLATLKKQIKDTKDELKMKQDELEAMKRNTKFTKVQELDMELRAFTDENIRLKNMFEELMRTKPQIKPEDYNMLEEKYYMQVNMIETLQRDHARMAAEIKYLEDQNYTLQVSREQEAKNAQKQQSELSRLRKLMKEKELKALPNYKLDSSLQKAGFVRADDKSRHDDELGECKKQLEQKNQIINQRDKAIEELRQKLNEKTNTEMKDKAEINNLREQYAELESKYRAILGVNYTSEEKKKTVEVANHKNDHEHPVEPKPEKPVRPESRGGKKLKKVSFDDVKNIGYELNLKMRVRSIPLEEIMKFLDGCGPKITISEMKNILIYDPFGLKEESVALLIARYLVEPHDQENILLDYNRAQDTNTVKNGFKKLVGNYTLLDEEEEKAMAEELSDILGKYEESLKTQFSLMPEAKTGFLSSDQIAEAFDQLEIEINPKTFEYLVMNLYEYTESLKKLDFKKMFEFFETDEKKKLKQIMEMYNNEDDDEESERSGKRVQFKEQAQKNKARAEEKAAKQEEEEEEYEEDYQEEEEDYEEEAYESDGGDQ